MNFNDTVVTELALPRLHTLGPVGVEQLCFALELASAAADWRSPRSVMHPASTHESPGPDRVEYVVANNPFTRGITAIKHAFDGDMALCWNLVARAIALTEVLRLKSVARALRVSASDQEMPPAWLEAAAAATLTKRGQFRGRDFIDAVRAAEERSAMRASHLK